MVDGLVVSTSTMWTIHKMNQIVTGYFWYYCRSAWDSKVFGFAWNLRQFFQASMNLYSRAWNGSILDKILFDESILDMETESYQEIKEWMKCNQQKKAHSQSSRGRILSKVKTKQTKNPEKTQKTKQQQIC
jgi:hypothetical protein